MGATVEALRGELTSASDVPAGRYAVEGDNRPRLVIVERARRGRWVGWTFVYEQRGSAKTLLQGALRARALREVEADPRGAAERYGRATGRCAVCGRELTGPASIRAGIGPKCASELEI